MFYDISCCMTVIKWWLSPPFSRQVIILTFSLPASSKVYSGRTYSIFLKNLITFSTSYVIEWTWNLNTVFVFKLLQSIRFKNCIALHGCWYLRAYKVDDQISLSCDCPPYQYSHEMTPQPKPLAAASFMKEPTSEVQCQSDFSSDPTQEIILFIKWGVKSLPVMFLYEEILPVTGKTQAGLHARLMNFGLEREADSYGIIEL